MLIATWNINSVRSRIERVTDFLHREGVDVLALQETKVKDDAFPVEAFAEAGYDVAFHGLNQWNGVAIASRVGLENVRTSFPEQPGYHNDASRPQEREARALGAQCGGVDVWSLYVPNGREITHRHYSYKLRFLYALAGSVATAERENRASVWCGDFNVAPQNDDVWDRAVFAGKTHVTEPERAALASLVSAGAREVTRQFTPGEYTYWDYKAGRFSRNDGMRIDFQFATSTLAQTATAGAIVSSERRGRGASDHAPVCVDYAVAS